MGWGSSPILFMLSPRAGRRSAGDVGVVGLVGGRMGPLDVTPLMGAAAGEPGHETSSPLRRFRRACACGSFAAPTMM